MSVVWLFIVFVIPFSSSLNYLGIEANWLLASDAGALVIQQIGWAFGVFVPTLLGFYVTVVGGQLVSEPAVAYRTRRTLGLVAEAMTAAMMPALVLIAIACISEPARAGTLFVIVPVSAVMFFLAVQLGGFVVFEQALRLASAQKSFDWSRARLVALRRRSTAPVPLVFILNAVVGAAAGLGTILVFSRSVVSIVSLFSLLSLLAFGLVLTNYYGVYSFHTSRDRASRIVAYLLPASMNMMVLALSLDLIVRADVAAGLGVLATAAVVLASTLWMPLRGINPIWNWSIQGSGRRLAAISVARTYVASFKTIQDFRTRPGQRLSLSERLIAAWRLVLSNR
ncbi:conserved membrane protein of unknown function [Agreia sp. COWG]|nr:conserved membrane protein of unknown function [Agreia sp. COWG]